MCFSAWCLQHHSAVHCSHRRGESDLPSARRDLSQAGLGLTCVCVCVCRLFQLHVSQWLGAGAAGENPGHPPGSGESLLQQRAMSAAQTRRPSARCSPALLNLINVPKLSLSPCFSQPAFCHCDCSCCVCWSRFTLSRRGAAAAQSPSGFYFLCSIS